MIPLNFKWERVPAADGSGCLHARRHVMSQEIGTPQTKIVERIIKADVQKQ